MLASLLFVQFQNELTGEKEDFRGFSALTNSTHGVWNSFSIYLLSGVYSPFPDLEFPNLDKLAFTSNSKYLVNSNFMLIEYDILETSYKKKKLEQKRTRC